MSRDETDDIFNAPVQHRPPITYVCPRHGTYSRNVKAHWQDQHTCPACIEVGRAIKTPWQEAWTTYARWQRARIPERFGNRRLCNYRAATQEQQRALGAAQAIAQGDMQAIALIGSVGTGKTHLSVAIVADAVRAGTECLWLTVPDLFREWKATFAKGAEMTEQQIIDRIDQAKLLVLDEIGVGNRSEWEAAQLFALVDERYREGGRLVLTGNITDLAGAIGDRAADRIEEMGTVVTLTGASYRSKAADDPALQVDDDFTKPPDRIEWTVCDAGVDRIEVRDKGPRPAFTGKASHQPLEHSR